MDQVAVSRRYQAGGNLKMKIFSKVLAACVMAASGVVFPGPTLGLSDMTDCPVNPQIVVSDVTTQWVYRWEVISAFPRFYDRIPREENADIIRVFKVTKRTESTGFPDTSVPFERRVEVFYTGGDWMEFGFTYFVTDAHNPHHGGGAYGGAYFISDMSTTDREEGAEPPKVDPLNPATLASYISTNFLDASGEVKATFKPL
ncbi:MAG: hypothetical protein RIQ81_1778 [Pseudomonadota bacterium]|jgi:hypothetical protein